MYVTIVFDPLEGDVVPDGKVKEYVQPIIDYFKYTPSPGTVTEPADIMQTVGCESIINQLRIAIVEGEIPFEKIVFVFEGEELKPTKYGSLPKWPRGFCDVIGKQCGTMVKTSSAMRKADHNF